MSDSDRFNNMVAEIERNRAEIERLRNALKSVVNACDQGKLTALGGAYGMTIEAQIRGSVYHRVPAWPVEEARAELERIADE